MLVTSPRESTSTSQFSTDHHLTRAGSQVRLEGFHASSLSFVPYTRVSVLISQQLVDLCTTTDVDYPRISAPHSAAPGLVT